MSSDFFKVPQWLLDVSWCLHPKQDRRANPVMVQGNEQGEVCLAGVHRAWQ